MLKEEEEEEEKKKQMLRWRGCSLMSAYQW